jgi:hypothetical protein
MGFEPRRPWREFKVSKKRRDQSRATYTGYQADTKETAILSGCEWSAIEDMAILASELPIKALALGLGRTYWAVAKRPRKLQLAAL